MLDVPSSEPAAMRGGPLTTVSPAMRELARQALLHEAGNRRGAAALVTAVEQVYGRLRDRLAGLIGLAGFRALFARALRLAKMEFPALAPVTFDAQTDQGLHGVPAFVTARPRALTAVISELAVIFAHLLGLLATFIGEELAIHLVRESWPTLAGQTASGEEAR